MKAHRAHNNKTIALANGSNSKRTNPLVGKLVAPLILILWVVIAMSPAAMEAFGQITGAEILSGTMDLQPQGRVIIDAMGRQNGTLMRFQCLWLGGKPEVITKVAVRGEI